MALTAGLLDLQSGLVSDVEQSSNAGHGERSSQVSGLKQRGGWVDREKDKDKEGGAGGGGGGSHIAVGVAGGAPASYIPGSM